MKEDGRNLKLTKREKRKKRIKYSRIYNQLSYFPINEFDDMVSDEEVLSDDEEVTRRLPKYGRNFTEEQEKRINFIFMKRNHFWEMYEYCEEDDIDYDALRNRYVTEEDNLFLRKLNISINLGSYLYEERERKKKSLKYEIRETIKWKKIQEIIDRNNDFSFFMEDLEESRQEVYFNLFSYEIFTEMNLEDKIENSLNRKLNRKNVKIGKEYFQSNPSKKTERYNKKLMIQTLQEDNRKLSILVKKENNFKYKREDKLERCKICHQTPGICNCNEGDDNYYRDYDEDYGICEINYNTCKSCNVICKNICHKCNCCKKHCHENIKSENSPAIFYCDFCEKNTKIIKTCIGYVGVTYHICSSCYNKHKNAFLLYKCISCKKFICQNKNTRCIDCETSNIHCRECGWKDHGYFVQQDYFKTYLTEKKFTCKFCKKRFIRESACSLCFVWKYVECEICNNLYRQDEFCKCDTLHYRCWY